MSETLYCYIGNATVGYTNYGRTGLDLVRTQGITMDPVSAGAIGQGTIFIRKTSTFTSISILPGMEVRAWIEDPTAGPAGLVSRRAWGFVGKVTIVMTPARKVKGWNVTVQDYNRLALGESTLVFDADSTALVSIASAKFKTQATAIVTALQAQGGSPARSIDAVSYVEDLTPGTALPLMAIRGITLGDALDQLCANYQAATGIPAGWHLGPERLLGGTGLANFAGACLFGYQTGITPTPGYLFSGNVPLTALHSPIKSDIEQDLDGLELGQWRQAYYAGPDGGVVTSVVAGSVALFPCDYAGDAAWKVPPVRYSEIFNSTDAQALNDSEVGATAYPLEQVRYSVAPDVQVGQYVGTTLDMMSWSSYVLQAKEVHQIPAPNDHTADNLSALVLGTPTLELGQGAASGQRLAPQVGDPTPPVAPVVPGAVSTVADGRATATNVVRIYYSSSLNTVAHSYSYQTNSGPWQYEGPIPVIDGATYEDVTIRHLLPGGTLHVKAYALNSAGIPSLYSPVLSTAIARIIIPRGDGIGSGSTDFLDPDTGIAGFSRGYTPNSNGSGTTPTRNTTTVFEGAATWQLPVGSSAGTSQVASDSFYAATPSSVISFDFWEGNTGAAQGVLELLIQPYDKTGATVGSAVAAYSAAPSTTATGVRHTGKYQLPSTSTITAFSWTIKYTGNAANARTVYVSEPHVVEGIGTDKTYFNDSNLLFYGGGIAHGEIHATDDGGGDGTLVVNAYGNGAGKGQLILKNDNGEFVTLEKTLFGISFLSGIGVTALAPFTTDLTFNSGWAARVAGMFKGHATATADLIQAWRGSTKHWWISATGHQGTAGTAPGVTFGAPAGTGASLNAITGTDSAVVVDFTTGSGCSAGEIFTLDYAAAYTNPPAVQLRAVDVNSATLNETTMPWPDWDASTSSACSVQVADRLSDTTRYVLAFWIVEL